MAKGIVAQCGPPAIFRVVETDASVVEGVYPPYYSTWIADAVDTAEYHAVNGWNDPESYYYATIDNIINCGQYEPWQGFRSLAQHIGGNATLETAARMSGDAYRDGYVLPNSGGLPGYRNYTIGWKNDWLINAEADSKLAVIQLSENATFSADTTPWSYLNIGSMREFGYSLEAMINAEVYCGEAHRARMEDLVVGFVGDPSDVLDGSAYGATGGDFTLTDGGMYHQLLGNYITDEDGNYVSGDQPPEDFNFNYPAAEYGFAPSVEGATVAWGLCQYHRLASSINGGITPDARIIPKLIRMADAQWNEYWIEDDEAMIYRPPTVSDGGTSGAPDLNTFVLPVYPYLYRVTGLPRMRERADKLFAGSRNSYGFSHIISDSPSKQLNQLLRWTIPALEDYKQGTILHNGGV